MDQETTAQVIEHNRRLHDAEGYAAWYDEHCGIMAHPWERTLFESDVRAIADLLAPVEGKTILDVGCGTGSLTVLLMEHGFSTVGLDLSDSMLAQLRQNAERKGLGGRLRTFAVASDEFLSDGEERFAAIVFSAVLHHLPDYLGTLRLAAERLAPGGLIYIVHEPSRSDRIGWAARCLERIDKFLYELPGTLRRQWRELREQGFVRGLAGKVKRKLSRRAQAGKPTDAAPAADWSLVDFHSNRGGCDEEAIAETLRQAGLSVDMQRYDSKRLRVFHALARLLHTKRMVRVFAQRDSEPTEAKRKE